MRERRGGAVVQREGPQVRLVRSAQAHGDQDGRGPPSVDGGAHEEGGLEPLIPRLGPGARHASALLQAGGGLSAGGPTAGAPAARSAGRGGAGGGTAGAQ